MDSFDIKKLENITYVNSQIVSAQIEMEAMKAANAEREHRGQSQAWDEDSFISLIDKYQLGHNSVLTNFMNGI